MSVISQWARKPGRWLAALEQQRQQAQLERETATFVRGARQITGRVGGHTVFDNGAVAFRVSYGGVLEDIEVPGPADQKLRDLRNGETVRINFAADGGIVAIDVGRPS